jgi:hypothetical protein
MELRFGRNDDNDGRRANAQRVRVTRALHACRRRVSLVLLQRTSLPIAIDEDLDDERDQEHAGGDGDHDDGLREVDVESLGHCRRRHERHQRQSTGA